MPAVILTVNLSDEKVDQFLSALKKFGAEVTVNKKELSITQAAEKHGWTKRSLYRWAKEEKLIPFKQHRNGGMIYFLESDLEDFAENRGRKKAAARTRRKKSSTKHLFM